MTTPQQDAELQRERLRARQAEIGQCLSVVALHGGGDTQELEAELAAIELELKKCAPTKTTR